METMVVLDYVDGFLSASLDYVDEPEYVEDMLDKLREVQDKLKAATR